MALTIVRGFTFAGNETVTASKLHQLIEQALITGIDASNLAAGSEIITISGTQPSSPLIGTLWFDSGSALLRRWDGSTFKVIEVHVGDAQPTNVPLQEGQLWVDTTGATTLFKVFDGSSFITVLIGTIDLTTDVTGVLPEANGGTGQSTYAQGDILYADATDSFAKLPRGTDGEFLKIGATIPEWATAGPEYDSGWFALAVATDSTKAHSLGQVPIRVTVMARGDVSAGTPFGGEPVMTKAATLGFTAAQGLHQNADATNIYLRYATAPALMEAGVGWSIDTNVDLRIFAWKT